MLISDMTFLQYLLLVRLGPDQLSDFGFFALFVLAPTLLGAGIGSLWFYFRPPAGCESPGSVVTAPPGVVQSRGTRNHLAWLHVRLFLESGPMPSFEVIGPHSCGNSVRS